jgi:hypothetical protein
MKQKRKVQDIVRKLIQSKFYFDMHPREWLDLIKDILRHLSVNHLKPMSSRGKGLYPRREG